MGGKCPSFLERRRLASSSILGHDPKCAVTATSRPGRRSRWSWSSGCTSCGRCGPREATNSSVLAMDKRCSSKPDWYHHILGSAWFLPRIDVGGVNRSWSRSTVAASCKAPAVINGTLPRLGLWDFFPRSSGADFTMDMVLGPSESSFSSGAWLCRALSRLGWIQPLPLRAGRYNSVFAGVTGRGSPFRVPR